MQKGNSQFSKIVHVQERKKVCNICLPLKRNSSGKNPCILILPQEKIRTNSTDFNSSRYN